MLGAFFDHLSIGGHRTGRQPPALVKWSWRPFWGCRRCDKSRPAGSSPRAGRGAYCEGVMEPGSGDRDLGHLDPSSTPKPVHDHGGDRIAVFILFRRLHHPQREGILLALLTASVLAHS